jgi:P-type Ca2+ transporter type 2C
MNEASVDPARQGMPFEKAAAAPIGSAESGLSNAQVAERLAQDGPNALPRGQRRTLLSIATETVREPMFLLLLAAGTLYLTFGDLQEGLTLFGFVLVTLALTLYQEGKTERAIEALRDLTLADRDRLAGQQGLVGPHTVSRNQQRIGRDAMWCAATCSS